MNRVAVVALCIIAAYVLYLPLKALSDQINSGKYKTEVEKLKAELKETNGTINKLQDQLRSAYDTASKAEQKNAELQRKLNDNEHELARLRPEQAPAPVRRSGYSPFGQLDASSDSKSPPSKSEPKAQLVDVEMPCPVCDGDWKHPPVRCEKKEGVGCDGVGHRLCFKCMGRQTMDCPLCRGTGKTTVLLGRTGSKLEPCERCKETGQVDCPECDTIWVREPREPGLPPMIAKSARAPVQSDYTAQFSGGRYRSGYFSWRGREYAISTSWLDWAPFEGHVICPRCSGTGWYNKKSGTCKECAKGVVHTTVPADRIPEGAHILIRPYNVGHVVFF
jgi:hypothetical protein